MKNCGVIEGFFGIPWSWPARAAYADFLKDNGYHFYIYAPKADAFLRRQWHLPWPRETAERVAALAGEFHARDLAFGIGWSPFEAYLQDRAEVFAQLSAKARELNGLGCDILCILFDDMYGAIENLARLQIDIVHKIADTTTAKKLIVCPTYYSFDPILDKVFGARPADYLATLGAELDAAIDLFWTGPKVISEDYTRRDIAAAADLLRRPPFIWDNALANDGEKSSRFLRLDGFAARARVFEENIAGLAINPMNQAWLSRIALQALAESSNTGAGHIDGSHSFARVCETLCGGELAGMIGEDLHAFQRQGLVDLEGEGKLGDLIEKYRRPPGNPFAGEIGDWLSGKYTFDPACLTE